MYARASKHYREIVLIFLACVALFLWSQVFASSDQLLTVAFLNIGQGDAIYIEGPNGNQLLIDGGAGGSILSELGAVMPFADRDIDVVIATHPDADHVGGLVRVLDRYRVSAVVEPGSNTDTAVYRTLEQEIKDKQIPRIIARRGMKIDLGRGVTFTVFYPDRDASAMETNESSIVGQLRYGSTTVLLTGDAPQSVERYLLSQDGLALASNVLKLGHHGSRTSSDPEFIDAVAAQYAIISAGKDNRYGHPHKEVLETLAARPITVLRTDVSGRIEFESDGGHIIQK